ncbi:MAG: hypothetical protein PF961_03425, partial [Planctomycetota bacterium]|nr:hypothetical protein [Planctomycetota bacterium]
AEALQPLRDAPGMLGARLTGLLACQGLLPTEQGLTALNGNDGQGSSWNQTDPLAYALARLLQHRAGAPPVADSQGPGEASPLAEQVPPALGRFKKLLGGKPVATMLVFSFGDANLPPLHALAAALAMQEVAGLKPDWSLLSEAPCLDLPLELMIPAPAQGGSQP